MGVGGWKGGEFGSWRGGGGGVGELAGEGGDLANEGVERGGVGEWGGGAGARVGDWWRGEEGPRLTKSSGLGRGGSGRGLCYLSRGDQMFDRKAGIAVERPAR